MVVAFFLGHFKSKKNPLQIPPIGNEGGDGWLVFIGICLTTDEESFR